MKFFNLILWVFTELALQFAAAKSQEISTERGTDSSPTLKSAVYSKQLKIYLPAIQIYVILYFYILEHKAIS